MKFFEVELQDTQAGRALLAGTGAKAPEPGSCYRDF